MATQDFLPWRTEDVLQPLYEQLRQMARARLQGGGGNTLSATALVHEVMLRMLSGMAGSAIQDDTHFIATASRMMRQILVDHARRKAAGKRQNPDPRDSDEKAWENFQVRLSPEEILDINTQLERLGEEDPVLAHLVELRVFGGLTFAEIGALLHLDPKTAERRWRYAAAVLRERIIP